MDESERNPWDPPENDPAPAPESLTAPVEEPNAPTSSASAEEPGAPPVAPATDEPDIDPNRKRVVLIALAAFVAIAVIGFLLSRGSSSDPNQSGDSSATTAPVFGGSSSPAQTITIKGTNDPFGRSDDAKSLGAVPNGSKWVVQKGSTWGISGGQAYVSKPDANVLHRNIAIVGSGFANGQVQVTVARLTTTAGIVFRYSGECSYWALEAAPKYATWNLTKVDKCKATQIANTGYTAASDGVTVGVLLTDKTITVVVNGKAVKVIQNGALSQNPGNVGMTVSGPDSGTARFDDFIAGGPDGQGILTADVGKVPSKGSATTQPK